MKRVHQLLGNMQLNKVQWCKIDLKHFQTWCFKIEQTVWLLLLMKRVQRLPENIQLSKVQQGQIDKKYFKVLGRTPPFLLQKNDLKTIIFRAFLPLIDPLVAISMKQVHALSENMQLNLGRILGNFDFFGRSSLFLMQKNNLKI